MTFDEWADRISTRVTAALPDVNTQHKLDDVRRWIHPGKECQLHALSESEAAFVALRREGMFTNSAFSFHVGIAATSEEEVARRIIGWFGK